MKEKKKYQILQKVGVQVLKWNIYQLAQMPQKSYLEFESFSALVQVLSHRSNFKIHKPKN